jgi:phosphohistidine phosphatase
MRLFLLRHAEALPGQNDRERPLSAHGRAQALSIGRQLHGLALAPEYAICSPAQRTCETYNAVSEFIPQTALIYPEYMYNASVETLVSEMAHFSDTYGSVLLVGHNPGIHDFARALAEAGDAQELAALAAGFPPATLAVIDCAGEKWAEVRPRGNTLRHLLGAA